MTEPHDDIHGRDPYSDDELVPFDVQSYSGSRGMWLLGLLFLLALIVLFIIFKVYQPGVRDRDQAPQILASEAPDKVVAEATGEDDNPDLNLEIYDAMNGKSNETDVKVTESSEEPVKRPGDVKINVIDRSETVKPVPAPTKPAEPQVQSPATEDSRHVVQLASLRTRAAADDTWKGILEKHGAVLPKGTYMNVIRADVPNKGTFYRLRLAGLPGKAVADQVCSRLKARNQSCFTTTK